MKKLDDFVSTLQKEEDTSKPKPLNDGEGEDDAQYWELMMKYKQERRNDPKGSVAILKKAQDLIKNGDVSNEAMVTAAYM